MPAPTITPTALAIASLPIWVSMGKASHITFWDTFIIPERGHDNFVVWGGFTRPELKAYEVF